MKKDNNDLVYKKVNVGIGMFMPLILKGIVVNIMETQMSVLEVGSVLILVAVSVEKKGILENNLN